MRRNQMCLNCRDSDNSVRTIRYFLVSFENDDVWARFHMILEFQTDYCLLSNIISYRVYENALRSVLLTNKGRKLRI